MFKASYTIPPGRLQQLWGFANARERSTEHVPREVTVSDEELLELLRLAAVAQEHA